MANLYNYSNTAIQTTLSGSVSSGATSIGVAATTGFPGSFPYVLALDYGAATEELVVVTAAGGTTLTVTRGHSGTSAQSHSLGAVVRHVWHAGDATDFRTHEAATSSVHGVTGALVGATMVQTLTNKTLTSPTVNSPAIAGGGSLAGTFTGTPTFSGALTLSGGATIAGGALSGTFTGAPTLSGNVVFSGTTPTFVSPSFSGTPSFAGNATFAAVPLFTGGPQFNRANSTDSAQGVSVTGDGFDRHRVLASGLHEWGPGSGARDTNLYRSAANTLKTDDALVVTGAMTSANLPTLFLWGETTFNFAASSQSDNAIVFSSTFTTQPRVVAMFTELPSGSSALIVRANNITTSGMTLRANDVGGVSRTLSITASWFAVA